METVKDGGFALLASTLGWSTTAPNGAVAFYFLFAEPFLQSGHGFFQGGNTLLQFIDAR